MWYINSPWKKTNVHAISGTWCCSILHFYSAWDTISLKFSAHFYWSVINRHVKLYVEYRTQISSDCFCCFFLLKVSVCHINWVCTLLFGSSNFSLASRFHRVGIEWTAIYISGEKDLLNRKTTGFLLFLVWFAKNTFS